MNHDDPRSLAERLGYGPKEKLLIINCDDLGSSHGANVAAFRAMTSGVARSATLMVPCPWAREAARLCKNLAVGVHLTLTCEYRGYRWRGLTNGATLTDKEGYFPTTTKTVAERVSAADALAECRAQIETALGWGLDVTHIDTHMGSMQARPDLFDLYLDLAVEYRLPVRMPASAEAHTTAPRARAQKLGVLFNDFMISPWPRRTRDVLFEEIPKLKPGVSEMYAHPVQDGEELRAYDTDHADIRAHDSEFLLDPTVAERLREHEVTLINYRAIRDLQRAAA